MIPRKPPEVAVIRSILVAITAVVVYFGGPELGGEQIDNLCTLYAILAPVIAGLWIRRGVTPTVARAVTFTPKRGKHRL